jgi:erythromycin esterase-like protein
MAEVVAFLDRVDPVAAGRARNRYACFDQVADEHDGQVYGHAAAFGAGESCERQVIAQLTELQLNAFNYARDGGEAVATELFDAERNAWSVRDAEEYYRSMFGGRVESWNLRDSHMAHTAQSLLDYLDLRCATESRIVVWAHNSHVGDARAAEMGGDGQLTLGQLIKERHGRNCRLIGFSTYSGTVTAASDWGGRGLRRAVTSAMTGSVEQVLHDTGLPAFMIRSDCADPAAAAAFAAVRDIPLRPMTGR